MSRARLIRLSLLPGFLALTLLMAYATDVISSEVPESPWTALSLAVAALAAISLAGAVLTAAHKGTE
jgi:hypothetical protein